MEVVKQLIGRGCPIDHQDDVVRFLAFLALFWRKKIIFQIFHMSQDKQTLDTLFVLALKRYS